MSTLFDNLDTLDFKEFYAHSKKVNNNLVKEIFIDHCGLTEKYYKKIVDKYKINGVLRKLLVKLLPSNDEDKLISILDYFVKYHDLGKLTSRFQEKLNGKELKSPHSKLSFYTFIYFLLLENKSNNITGKEFFLLSIILYSVFKHHGKLNNISFDFGNLNPKESDKNKVITLLKNLNIYLNKEIIELIFSKSFWKRWREKPFKQYFSDLRDDNLTIFILVKLFHSLLITSDYFATMEFMNDEEIFEFNIFNNAKIRRISEKFHKQQNFEDFYNFNVDINENKEKYRNLSLSDIGNNEQNKNELNKLRSKINVKAEDRLENILNSKDKNVYFLNVPTGGGKTNLSLRLSLKIMEKKEINKLFYVFPFINIIEQSYNSLKTFFGEDNVTRIDSRFVDDDESEEINEENIFCKYVNNLFFNKPALFTSHVRFFDLFFRNDKSSNYNFYQLTNSIVVIDEIQAYDDKIWTEVINVLSATGKLLNIHFIIMSATIPKLDKLIMNNKNREYSFDRILDNDFTNNLFEHKLFKRNKIIPKKNLTQRKLIKEIKKNIQNEKINKILIVVNTVGNSLKLFQEIYDIENAELFLLNSTIIHKRRIEVLTSCQEEDKNIILVSTQSIEAGVDLDFDVGYRAYAPLDSMIQVAGRINRNIEKPYEVCKLYAFKDRDFRKVYRDDYKSKISEKYENKFFEKKIIKQDDLKAFYDKAINDIKSDNNNIFIKSSSNNISDIKNLYFKNIDKNLLLIEGDTLSLFIPYEESADEIWDEYMKIFEEKGSIKKIAKMKEYQKKLQPYVVNVFNGWTNKGKLKILLQEEIKYGYYYCDNYEKYFSYEKGIDQEKFKETTAAREVMFL